MNAPDVYDEWLWLTCILILLAWGGAAAFAWWTDRRHPKPRRVMRDWATESKCRVTRRGFKTRAGIR